MVGWHHQLNGPEFEQTLGYSEGQESLVSCSPWGGKESNTTQQLNNNNNKLIRADIESLIGILDKAFSPKLNEET